MSNIVIQIGNVKVDLPLDTVMRLANTKPAPVAKPAPKYPADVLARKPKVKPTVSHEELARTLETAPIHTMPAPVNDRTFGARLSKRLKTMKAGESIFIPCAYPQKVQWSANGAAHHIRSKGGRLRITTRKQIENGQPGVRVWRLA